MHLILTQHDDPHADMVIDSLVRKGSEYVRFETADFPQKIRAMLRYEMDTEDILSVSMNRQRVDLSRVRTVWYRRPELPVPQSHLSAVEQEFVRRESQQFLGALWRLLRDRFWVNAYASYQTARLKPYQLQVARKIGFEVPHTLITNDAAEALRFFEQCQGRMIYKTFNAHARTEQNGKAYGIYTSQVKKEDLAAKLGEIRLAPCMFQEYVPKKVEIRVTVIGRKVFAAEIRPEGITYSKYDWRRDRGSVSYRPFDLPGDLEVKVLEMLQQMGLVFGCIDLILTQDERFVFLEINPNGQWYWIEQRTGMPLLHNFTEMLIHGTVDYF
ncbi:MAG TPA: hypothetical protein VGR84_04400 [Candidatus Acidoferrales bacterium]|nr:hypothetical protein [Candidatus Acidoferrales bacterium]